MIEKSALIVVDMQHDFIDGTLPVPGAAEIGPRVVEAAKVFHTGGGLVVATRDWHSAHMGEHFDKWPAHCVAGTWGASLYDGVVGNADAIFNKGQNPKTDSYSGFDGVLDGGTVRLAAWLKRRGIERVMVCGLAYDYCVGETALDARAWFKTFVLKNETAAVDSKGFKSMTARLQHASVEVI